MEKIKSIRKGQIWLTVYKTDDGELAITINKSYPTTTGWKKTNFLRPDDGDINRLYKALREFSSLQAEIKKGACPPWFFSQLQNQEEVNVQ